MANGANMPFTKKELQSKVFALTKTFIKEFQDPTTGVIYNARLSTKAKWTSPADCKAKKPKPWGYGSRYSDTVLYSGHLLGAMLDAYEAKPTEFLKVNCQKLYNALKYIYESCPIPGIVPRGPHPDDRTAYYDDSSMDQNTTFIISLSIYAQSKLATDADKIFIKKALNEVGTRLEKHDWSVVQADGKTQCHVGFSWLQMTSKGASIILPAVYSLYKGTGNQHWLEVYNKLGNEANGRRWKLLAPGDHSRINAHPIYANQACFRLNIFYKLLSDKKQRQIVSAMMYKAVELQLARDFPGKFMRRFIKEKEIKATAKKFNWPDDDIHGSLPAWKLFDAQKLKSCRGKVRSVASLAHIRFPMGAFHMIMNSEDPQLIEKYTPYIWQMLNDVDLSKVYSAETNYLFTVVALHLYAFYCHQQALNND
jgi:hypothetical protein